MRILFENMASDNLFDEFIGMLSATAEFDISLREGGPTHPADAGNKDHDVWLVLTEKECETTLSLIQDQPERLRHAPVIVIDASHQAACRDRYIAAGVTECLDYRSLNLSAFKLIAGLAVRMHHSKRAAQEEAIKFDMLRETLQVGTWDWDLRKNTFAWSEREYALFGIDPAAGKLMYTSWCDVIHPQDRERVEAELGRAMVGQADYHSVFRILKRKVGESPGLRWIESVGRVERDEHGGALHMYGLSWDVTTKYQAVTDLEAKRNCTNCLSHHSKNPFQIYFEQSSDCMFHIVETTDGRLLYTAMNRVALNHVGLSIDRILGRTPVEVLGREVGGAIEAGIRTASRTAQPYFYKPTFEMGGSSIVYDAAYIPIFNETGQVAGVLGCARDITAGRQMEESLLRAQKMEALGRMASSTAHDFNNILQSVGGAMALIERVRNPDSLAQAIQICRTAIKCGQALTSGLLAFARREELRVKPSDLNATIAGLLDMLRLTVGANIELQVQVATDLWPAMMSEQQVELAIINLVVNARDAMPEGGKVRLQTSNATLGGVGTTPPPGDYVCLAVADTGEGMAPDVLSRATEPFYTTKEAGKGTGLGLAMVQATATSLGGGIKITSAVGKGTTVSMYLPRAAATVEA